MYLPESAFPDHRQAIAIERSLPTEQAQGRRHIRHRGHSKAPVPPWRSLSLRQHSRKRLPTPLVRPGNSQSLRGPPLARRDPRRGSRTAARPVGGRNEPGQEPPHSPGGVPLHACPWPEPLPDPTGPCHSLATRCGIGSPDDWRSPTCVHKLAEECSRLRRSGRGKNSWTRDCRTEGNVGVGRDFSLGYLDRSIKSACPLGGKPPEQIVGTRWVVPPRIGLKPRLEGLVRLFQVSRDRPVVGKVDEKSLAIADTTTQLPGRCRALG